MFHVDSFQHLLTTIENRVTGLGRTGYDSLSSSQVNDTWLYQNQRFLYDTFYHNLWQVRRVCDLRPYQMGNAWGKFTLDYGDVNAVSKVNKFLDGLRRKYQQAQMLANKDGMSTIIRLIDDGQVDFSQPVDIDNIKSIRFSRPFDRWEIYPDPQSYLINPYNPEFYLAALNHEDQSLVAHNSPISSIPDIYKDFQSLYRIHRDRVIRFRGDFISASALQRNQGCESSILPGFLSPLMRYCEAMGYVGESVRSFELVVFLIDDLLAGMQTRLGQDNLSKRFLLNNSSMSSIRSLYADKKTEDVKLVSRTYGGVSDILQQLRLEMRGASGLDEIELFQEHPKGMAATGQSERLEKAMRIMQLCDYEWTDNLIGTPTDGIKGDIDYYLASDESPIKGTNIDWDFIWNSAIALTPLEESELRERYAAIDKINIESGVYTPKIARDRYTSTEFSTDILIDESQMNELTQLDEDNKKMKEELTLVSPTKTDAVERFIPKDNQELPESDYDKILKELLQNNG